MHLRRRQYVDFIIPIGMSAFGTEDEQIEYINEDSEEIIFLSIFR